MHDLQNIFLMMKFLVLDPNCTEEMKELSRVRFTKNTREMYAFVLAPLCYSKITVSKLFANDNPFNFEFFQSSEKSGLN